jgi:hypothetical protein
MGIRNSAPGGNDTDIYVTFLDTFQYGQVDRMGCYYGKLLIIFSKSMLLPSWFMCSVESSR